MSVLLFDLETSPNVGYFWSTGYKINIGYENIIQERQVICIAYKWLDEKKVHSLQWSPKSGPERDRKMLKDFVNVCSKASAIVGHNSDNFDLKWLRTRLLFHGLDPLPKIRQQDTLKFCRQNFKFNSNRLDYVANYIGAGGKSPMSFNDWKQVMNGSKSALNKMVKYCKQDVVILEDVYKQLSLHIPGKVNKSTMEVFDGRCQLCDTKLIKQGFYSTEVGKYQRYKCTNHKCRKVWVDTRQVKDG